MGSQMGWGGGVGGWFSLYKVSDRARHFSNRSDIYKAAKVIHGDRSNNRCKRLDTRPSSVLLLELC